MKPLYRSLLVRSITSKLRKFPKPGAVPPPTGGWLRAIRFATGMPASYPAKKLKLSRQAFGQMEGSEAAGTITLKSLKRAADAMNCDLVYAIVPRDGSVRTLINTQAVARAKATVLPVAHSMALENQESKPGPNVMALARRLATSPGRTLWNG
jgi:predicted DNA-binding mobile mystery protein A